MRIQPWDAENQRLVDAVHPADWRNPEPAPRYNLVVIGGGAAGLVSAMGAAGLGAKVALVERAFLGGDCLVSGCVPSKSLLAAAHAAHAARQASRHGVRVADVHVDFGEVMRRLRESRADIAPHDSASRLREAGVDVYFGDASFSGPRSVRVGHQELHFRRAVIATGGRAWIPPVPGLEQSGYLTNESVFSLTELPRRLAVIGGGPIGCELAQAFARLGSEVTLLEMTERLLPKDDPDAAAVVRGSLAADGVRLLTGARLTAASEGDTGKRLHYEAEGPGVVDVDQVLVATGRRTNLEGLELDSAGVARDDKGRLLLDDRLRTSNPAVFGAGDVAGGPQFTHAADAMARVVLQNALFWGRKRLSSLVVPWATYTDPEVAHVGMGVAELESRGDARSLTVEFSQMDRAIVERDTRGFARVHFDRHGSILALTIVGAGAGNLIGAASLAMSAGLKLSALGSAVVPYPTQAEVLKRLGDAYARERLTPGVRAFFVRLFSWLR